MTHTWNPETFRCSACGERWSPATAGLPCRPDDGAAFVASLADRPSDTEPPEPET